MIFEQLVDERVNPDQRRNDDRGDDRCNKHAHCAGIVGNGKDKCSHVQGNKKDDAEDGEYLFYFFHENSLSCFMNRDMLSVIIIIVVESREKSKQIFKKVLENWNYFAIIGIVYYAHDNIQRWYKHGIITGVAEGCLQ